MFCGKCGLIIESCVCALREKHMPDCRYLIAASLSVELVCEHGFQACPRCDPCSCGAGEDRAIA
jgi:hypothetical protein